MAAAVPALKGAVELKEISSGRFAAHGPFTFTTARRARETGLTVLRAVSSGQIEIDCSGITSSDSAGMAVLLDWLGAAKHSGRSLHYTSLPEQVQELARITDVLELLEKGV
jgi:phospholipid transport system transporter-binding protein